MLAVSLGQLRQLPQETLPLLGYWVTLFAAVVALLASSFAIFSIDVTGITDEGRVTSLIPIALAACGLALTARWAPERTPHAVTWLALHIPGLIVGLRTPEASLQQTLKLQQSIADRNIAIGWELRQLSNRINLLEQLLQPGGPDPLAQKKLVTTGNSLEKYYADTKEQLEDFLQNVEEDSQRVAASQMLATLQQMQLNDR